MRKPSEQHKLRLYPEHIKEVVITWPDGATTVVERLEPTKPNPYAMIDMRLNYQQGVALESAMRGWLPDNRSRHTGNHPECRSCTMKNILYDLQKSIGRTERKAHEAQ